MSSREKRSHIRRGFDCVVKAAGLPVQVRLADSIRTRIGAVTARNATRPDPTRGLGLSSGTALSGGPEASGLLRGISRPLLVALIVNSIIGAGILGLPGRAYALAGTWSLLAWVLCGILMGAVALCFAEVGSRFT